jgi:energy-converting hydrogenase A subunit R
MEFDGLDDMMPYEGKVFISDCEGPITKNDNAHDLCAKFIPNGSRFFSVLARYDGVLSEVVRKEGFKSGDAVKLVLPFLKAFGVTDMAMVEFSRRSIMMIPGGDKTMRYVQEITTPFIVSSSYEHYVAAVCDHIGFPFENSYCTKCSLDSVKMDDWESQTLRDLAYEIAAMPLIEVPFSTRTIKDMRLDDRKYVQRLDHIFWNEMTDLDSYHLIMETVPIGDSEKAAAVVEVCKKIGVALEDCMYVGDNGTDSKALGIVRKGGGLAVSFNGNSNAVREADLAVMAPHTIVTSILAEAFYRTGKDAVLDIVEDWSFDRLKGSGLVHEYLLKEARRVFPGHLPETVHITPANMADLMTRSSAYRKSVRGEAIGSLN